MPLENRTGELEETSRRNSQDIARLADSMTEIGGRVEQAQSQADAALARATAAGDRATAAEQSLNVVRAGLDSYSLANTVTVNFPFDTYKLTPETCTTLDEVASQINDHDNYILEIEGFADSKGTEVYNNQLTAKRADAVRRYLTDKHNIPLFRMHVLGFGSLRAVADNLTEDGRAQNRRVEIHLLTRTVTGGAATRASQKPPSH
jgi:outer membrane protein OmpA-like peptidoglycan-associated protein